MSICLQPVWSPQNITVIFFSSCSVFFIEISVCVTAAESQAIFVPQQLPMKYIRSYVVLFGNYVLHSYSILACSYNMFASHPCS